MKSLFFVLPALLLGLTAAVLALLTGHVIWQRRTA